MKEIIALQGRGSSGKTTTLRLLYLILRSNAYQVVKTNYDPNDGDYFAILTKNKKLIGVTSSGDTYDLVASALAEMVSHNCEILLCACRTYDRLPPGTNAAINQVPNANKQFVPKTIAISGAQEARANQGDSVTLFNIIDALV